MSKKNIKTYAIAAAVALSAVAASAPAFAWGSGAPDSAYDNASGSNTAAAPRGHVYYNYAPNAVRSNGGYVQSGPDSYGFR